MLILALGERKREALARIRAGEPLPSAQVAPLDGEVVWIVDHAALGVAPAASRLFAVDRRRVSA